MGDVKMGSSGNQSAMVNGYVVRSDFGDKVPRIQDLELAKRLEFERPRAIRQLIERLQKAGNLSDSGICHTVWQNQGKRGRPATEYWLDERSALKVILRSETAVADKISDEVIDVFMRVRHGQPQRHHLLVDDLLPWQLVFGDVTKDMCRLYGKPYDGRSPVWLAGVWAKLYKLIAGEDCYAEMKQRNPEPSHGSNHHQMFPPKVLERFKLHLDLVGHTARVSVSKKDFWQRIKSTYKNLPMQLPLDTDKADDEP